MDEQNVTWCIRSQAGYAAQSWAAIVQWSYVSSPPIRSQWTRLINAFPTWLWSHCGKSIHEHRPSKIKSVLSYQDINQLSSRVCCVAIKHHSDTIVQDFNHILVVASRVEMVVVDRNCVEPSSTYPVFIHLAKELADRRANGQRRWFIRGWILSTLRWFKAHPKSKLGVERWRLRNIDLPQPSKQKKALEGLGNSRSCCHFTACGIG